ncbi:hypothetical protein ONZ45_g16642 [Pleurotus djamor]|nr:hypothetical protein ONZ45_g16642 [Pleurotus djamor]
MQLSELLAILVRNPTKVPLLYSLYSRRKELADSQHSDDESTDMARCWKLLDMTSKTFAVVIRHLPGDLRPAVCLLYLVLRALDTIEDDMTLDLEQVKLPMLRSFHESISIPGWTFNGSGPNEKDRQLLVEFDVVIRELEQLNPSYRKIVNDACHDMAYGMADFCKKQQISTETASSTVETVKDLDLYCHYVAGLVGQALSRLFAASGYERHWLRDQDVLSNSWGLFLQKVNILRDYREDVDDSRCFWPQRFWLKHGFVKVEEMYDPEREDDALSVLSEMVVEALSHAVDVLDYLEMLQNPQVFEFVAIPVVMAMLTAKVCFMNPAVFQTEVKPNKQEYLPIVACLSGINDVAQVFSDSARVIRNKARSSDPNYRRICSITSEMFPSLPSPPSAGLALPCLALGWIAIYAATSLYIRRAKRNWNHHIALLGVKPKRKIKGTAVIAGGSIAGMITARVCAEHFENVIVIDPDTSKDGTKSRVAQYDSLHAYLTFMVEGLRRLWPNLDEAVESAGGIFRPGDFQLNFGGIPLLAAQLAYPTKNGNINIYDSSALPETMLIRRPQLEGVLRRLLKDSANVRFVEGQVTGVVPAESATRVDAITIRSPVGEKSTLGNIGLLVGSTQAGLKWMRSAGYITQATETPKNGTRISYDHKLRYVTITFENLGEIVRLLPIPEGFDRAGFIYTFYAHYRWGNEGFVLTRMDNETIQLCCGGWGDVNLPKERDSILPYVRNVKGDRPPAPWVIKVIEMLTQCESKGGNIIFKPLKIPAPSYVQYHHHIATLPSNFLAIGDSEMQLNPIFAQGCSKALFGAMTLNAILHERNTSGEFHSKEIGKAYFKRSQSTLDDIWTSTKAIDYGYETTIPVPGESRVRSGRLIRWYAYHAARASETDAVVASALWHARMLATPQVELFRPQVVMRVLWAALKGSLH